MTPASERERTRGGAATLLQSGLYVSHRVSKEMNWSATNSLVARPLKIHRYLLARKNNKKQGTAQDDSIDTHYSIINWGIWFDQVDPQPRSTIKRVRLRVGGAANLESVLPYNPIERAKKKSLIGHDQPCSEPAKDWSYVLGFLDPRLEHSDSLVSSAAMKL